jgi:hypothetical protein
MSEEKKPTGQPSQQQSPLPPPPQGARRPSEESLRPPAAKSQNDQVQAALGQAKNVLDQLGIDIDTGLKTLLLAVVFGVIGAILDRLFKLPTRTLFMSFGMWAAVLNGFTYASFRGRESIAALVMAACNGFVALLLWWIVTKLVGDRTTTVAGFKYTSNPADGYNILKMLVTGVIAGLLGLCWFMAVERLRDLKIKLG